MEKEFKRGIADIYDEEFYTNLKIAKNIIDQIKNETDKEICRKWIAKLCSLKSSDPLVKKNRNEFCQYLLQIMKLHLQKTMLKSEGDSDEEENQDGGASKNDFMAKWSPDKRTYVATKPLPGKGALVYMAVAKDPSYGWDHS